MNTESKKKNKTCRDEHGNIISLHDTQLNDLKKIKTSCRSFYIRLRCAGWQLLYCQIISPIAFAETTNNHLPGRKLIPFPSRLQITCVFKKFHNIPCIFVCLYKSNNFQVVAKTLVGRSN